MTGAGVLRVALGVALVVTACAVDYTQHHRLRMAVFRQLLTAEELRCLELMKAPEKEEP